MDALSFRRAVSVQKSADQQYKQPDKHTDLQAVCWHPQLFAPCKQSIDGLQDCMHQMLAQRLHASDLKPVGTQQWLRIACSCCCCCCSSSPRNLGSGRQICAAPSSPESGNARQRNGFIVSQSIMTFSSAEHSCCGFLRTCRVLY